MAASSDKISDPGADLLSRFPTAYTILFLLIVLVAALNWVIPANLKGPIDAEIPFIEGMILRFVILSGGLAICIAYVMSSASCMKAENNRSVVARQCKARKRHFLQGDDGEEGDDAPTGTQKISLVVFAATFVVMIWGVSSQGWWMAKMGALFLGAAIVVGLIGRLGEKRLTGSYIHGARDLLSMALIIGLARGIVVVMENGRIGDTILNASEQTLGGLSNVAFISTMFGIGAGMSFFVPSSSGLAVVSMPILDPLADFAGVGRDLVVTAYQSANWLLNLINPTFAVVIGGMAFGLVLHDRWIVFIWPLLFMATILIMGTLAFGTSMGGSA